MGLKLAMTGVGAGGLVGGPVGALVGGVVGLLFGNAPPVLVAIPVADSAGVQRQDAENGVPAQPDMTPPMMMPGPSAVVAPIYVQQPNTPAPAADPNPPTAKQIFHHHDRRVQGMAQQTTANGATAAAQEEASKVRAPNERPQIRSNGIRSKGMDVAASPSNEQASQPPPPPASPSHMSGKLVLSATAQAQLAKRSQAKTEAAASDSAQRLAKQGGGTTQQNVLQQSATQQLIGSASAAVANISGEGPASSKTLLHENKKAQAKIKSAAASGNLLGFGASWRGGSW